MAPRNEPRRPGATRTREEASGAGTGKRKKWEINDTHVFGLRWSVFASSDPKSEISRLSSASPERRRWRADRPEAGGKGGNARPKTNTRRRRENLFFSKVDRCRRAPINSLRGVRWNHALTKNLKSTRGVTSGKGGHFFARTHYRAEQLRPLMGANWPSFENPKKTPPRLSPVKRTGVGYVTSLAGTCISLARFGLVKGRLSNLEFRGRST